MTRDIVISAGHSLSDPGAQALGVNEADLTMKFRDALAHWFRQQDYRVITPNDEYSLRETIKEAKAFPKTLALEIHFNAFNGKAHGAEAFYTRADYLAFETAKAILEVHHKMGLKNRGAKTSKQSHRGRLGFVDELPHGLLLEVCFMDNPEDMALVESPKVWAEAVGLAIVKVLKRYGDSR